MKSAILLFVSIVSLQSFAQSNNSETTREACIYRFEKISKQTKENTKSEVYFSQLYQSIPHEKAQTFSDQISVARTKLWEAEGSFIKDCIKL